MPTGTTSFVRVAEVSRVHTSAPVSNSPPNKAAGCPFDPVGNTPRSWVSWGCSPNIHPDSSQPTSSCTACWEGEASSGMIFKRNVSRDDQRTLSQLVASARRTRYWLMFGCPQISRTPVIHARPPYHLLLQTKNKCPLRPPLSLTMCLIHFFHSFPTFKHVLQILNPCSPFLLCLIPLF